jgi:hypothetical protein
VWGSAVYTDDSDVVAILMHSGALSVRALPPADACFGGISAVLRVSPGKAGGDEDCYESTTQYGYRSREWPSKYDGRCCVYCVFIWCVFECMCCVCCCYDSTTQYGYRSREWPSKYDGKLHQVGFMDVCGLLFAVCLLCAAATTIETLLLTNAQFHVSHYPFNVFPCFALAHTGCSLTLVSSDIIRCVPSLRRRNHAVMRLMDALEDPVSGWFIHICVYVL